ncbi:MAG: peptidase U32 family protein [Planctomycetota bacterium]|jgi:putative protease
MSTEHPQPELLAPAGGQEALTAALEHGADAVYLGLRNLNARRGAENFDHHQLGTLVEQIHAQNARVYLTLNICLTERELGQAARALELARQAGVDAVLVRDPALLIFLPLFPELEFHFSTQAAVSSTAGMKAAKDLGIKRVVLARELSLEEIRQASAVEGIESEVFVQGALCFCVSGHCLLSSWVGGRSGNRGTCTSPCRVAWKTDASRPGALMSMQDLSLADHLQTLIEAGVSCFKIEGRLKTADWVGQAVTAYRKVLDGGDPGQIEAELQRLGNYTGRKLTDGFITAQREHLTGADTGRGGNDGLFDEAPLEEEDREKPGYSLSIVEGEKGLICTCIAGTIEESWRLPRTKVKRPDRALTITDLARWLQESPIQGFALEEFSTDDPNRVIPKKHSKTVADKVSAALHRAKKGPDTTIRTELPENVRAILEKDPAHPSNTRFLGKHADTVRLRADQAEAFARNVQVDRIVVEGAKAKGLPSLAKAVSATVIIALPAVFYEEDVAKLTRLVERCAELDLPVEVNSWGGWELARQAGVSMEGGPGLAILNSLAARQLAALGLASATLSCEADQKQLEDVCAAAGIPLSLTTFGRPPLMTTRVAWPESLMDKPLEDNRDVRGRFRQEGSVTVLRPERPFDWVGLRNESIRVAHLVIDLVGSLDPVEDWYSLEQHRKKKLRFNYERRLY